MKRITFFMLFFISIQLGFSQNAFTLRGTTSINEGDFYYVAILALQDSAVIDYRYFDTPRFEMANIKSPEFILRITSPLLYKNYSRLVSNMEKKPFVELGFIQLEPAVQALDEVTITGMRPKVKFSEGKLIYEIQNNKDFKTLNSFYDVLRRLPFVTVHDGKIDVFGKRNTVVLINGVPPKNDNWELISPDDIKEVEVITNPSAEYNAGGMAVVNIITKKSFAEGFNGQLSANIAKGDFWRSNNALQLGYATQRINLFANAGYNPNRRRYLESYERYFSTGEEMFNTINEGRKMPNNNHILVGIDYLLPVNHMLSLQYQRMYEHPKRNTVNSSQIFRSEIDNQKFNVHVNGAMLTEKNIYDMNYSFQIDSLGKKIAVNMGYVDYNGGEDNYIEVVSKGKSGNKESHSKADVQLLTAQADYLHITRNNFTGKIGGYYSRSQNNSQYQFFDLQNNEVNEDIPSDNEIRINEHKIAAYITGRKNWGKMYLSTGLRFEYADYSNKDKRGNETAVTYRDFFPSLEIGYDMNEDLKTNLSFSRKVNYPSFQDLDPTIQYVDTFTYNMGNTNLKPEFSYNTSLNIVYKRLVTLSLTYSRIDDPINPLFIKRLSPNSLIGVVSTENMEQQDTWTASLSFPFQYRFWTMMNALGVNYNKVKYKSEGVLLIKSKPMMYIYSYNAFALPKGFNLSLVYQYNSSGINGIIYHDSRHIVNAALNKSLLNDKLSVSLQYEDIFKGDKQKAWTEVSSIKVIQHADYDASFISLSLRYKFGKSVRKYDVKENSKDELQRIK